MAKIFERTLNRETEAAERIPGFFLKDILVGEKLRITTKNTEYILEHREDGFYMSGSPEWCPTQKKVMISGSTWGGSAIKVGFIGEGMFLEITSIQGADMAGNGKTTSAIEKVEKLED